MNTIIISHIAKKRSRSFLISLSHDNKSIGPITVTSPVGFPVAGVAGSCLIREMQWYLEDFLDYPFPPNTDRAQNFLDALDAWGRRTFDELFGGRESGVMFEHARSGGYENMRVQIMSDDPAVLQWPWEAITDPQSACLGLACVVERRFNKTATPLPIELPSDEINVLLVTARPYERDVPFRSISRSLVELVGASEIPASVHVLRPPTFANLREHLRARRGFYHILHFDGHGGYGRLSAGGVNPLLFGAAQGALAFESEKGEHDLVSAAQLSALLLDCSVPLVVLNACQSAMIDAEACDPFASVAAALVKSGVRGVAAMSYSLYVSAAQVFLPAFYRELFDTGSLSRAALAGRKKMFERTERVCARGRCELRDFVVPVVYAEEDFDLRFAREPKTTPPSEKQKPAADLPADTNPYGFIGRDDELLKLERALRKDTPAILIQGIGGVGKTVLARGFLEWLAATDGMDAGLWVDFREVRSAEFVVNAMGAPIFGPDFISTGMDERITRLATAMKKHRIVAIWDNFEVAAGIPGTYVQANLSEKDRRGLLSLLEKIRGWNGKVIITSRSNEDWLGIQRQRVSIGGLLGEEMWELCEKILDGLGIPVRRDDPDIVELMKTLGGHPYAMRIILPKLENLSARRIVEAVKSNRQALGPDADVLYAPLQFVLDKLTPELKPLLIPLALHEQFADSNFMKAMAKRVDGGPSDEKTDDFFRTLIAAGILRNVYAESVFELHPALTGFLRSTLLPSIPSETLDPWRRAFVDVMAHVADQLAPLELHKQRLSFHCHGINFRFALSEAERLNMDVVSISALTQSLASYAFHNRNFSEAGSLYERLSEIANKVNDSEGEASSYHQLGMIAAEQRDFKTAEKWYLKSLKIKEKLGDERDAASTYHQLGIISAEQRDYKTAEKWYLKSLKIEEKHGNEHGAAITYHQLGMISQEQRDFKTAEKWYLKSLEITEKLGIEHVAASTYHELGIIAAKQRDFKTAEKWYLKSLEIEEKHGNEHGAAMTYHQLGMISQEQRDFSTAEKWYLKSLEIKEKHGNEYGAAMTYGQMGILNLYKESFEESGKWYIKSITAFSKSNAPYEVERNIRNFYISYKTAPDEIKKKLAKMWEEADLGPFVPPESDADPSPPTPAGR